MKVYKIPPRVTTLIFDIDSTLYTNSAYAFEQIDCQVRAFAKERGISEDEARKMVNDYRKKYSLEHEGKKVSLGNTLLAFGISIEKSVKWRETLMEPSDYLTRDEKLIKKLTDLSSKYKMICVTNNPVFTARKTLEAIGISDFFKDIVGLDTCLKSKPAYEPFQTACKLTDSNPKECVAVGDRFDMDLSVPLELGMGGVLVNGVEDVYELNEILGGE
jgi:phosphoglycolate phosphatase/putative hydrolase of the HAD superfamily